MIRHIWSSHFSTGRTAASGNTIANMSCSKTFFLVNSVYIDNVLNARDPGDTTSKVSCCVEPSVSIKSTDSEFLFAPCTPIENGKNLKSDAFVVITLF